jgi:hypothetical protein
MRALVVYESMIHSTRELAEAIAAGMRTGLDVRLCRDDEVGAADSGTADLLVAGGPTHASTVSTHALRKQATAWKNEPGKGLQLDEPAVITGLRDWFDELTAVPPLFAAFDTRADVPKLLTGAGSVRIGRELRLRGSTPLVPPESFLVSEFAGLKSGEADRARAWGEHVAEAALGSRPRVATEKPM